MAVVGDVIETYWPWDLEAVRRGRLIELSEDGTWGRMEYLPDGEHSREGPTLEVRWDGERWLLSGEPVPGVDPLG